VISSFRLPDLVLGVSLKADTSGSRQAAQDLKRSIQREMGVIGGGGRGGLTSDVISGAVAGKVAGRMAGGVLGNAALTTTTREALAVGAAAGSTLSLSAALAASKLAGASAASVAKAVHDAAKGSIIAANSIAKGATAAGPALEAATAAAVGGGASKGFLSSLRSFRSIWHLIIGVLIIGTFKEAVKMLIPAFEYIRRSGAGGKFGEAGQEWSMLSATLENVKVQFGLMAISALNIGSCLENLNRGLARLGTILGFLAEHPLLTRMQIGGMGGLGALASIASVYLKIVDWLAQKIPTKGGIDLGGGGLSSRMGGAALEGSVEAYRIIQGTLMRYAAETAKNTKASAEALKQILNRAPAMGVVAG